MLKLADLIGMFRNDATNNDFPAESRAAFLKGFLTLLFALFCECLLAWGISIFYRPAIEVSEYSSLFVVPPHMFLPEPVERLQYLVLLFSLPFFLYGFYCFIDRRITTQNATVEIFKRGLAAASVLGALWILAAVSADLFFLEDTLFFHAVGVVLFVGIWGLIYFKGESIFGSFGARALSVLAFLVALSFVAFGFAFGPGMLDGGSQYGMHFGAVFNSVAEVYSGKTLLVDILNQYGLYPFFLKPLFRVLGLGVTTFTIVMSLLSVLAYVALYGFLRGVYRYKVTAFIAAGAIIFLQVWHQRLVIDEIYFQTVPLRIIMPTIGLLSAWLYFSRAARFYYILAALVCGTGILWNFDSGAPLFISWLAALIYTEWAALGFGGVMKKAPIHIAVNGAILALIIAVFAVSSRMGSRQWPQICRFFEYAGYFYGYGFNMLPMRPVHMWNLVALVYAFGLCFSVAQILRRTSSPVRTAVFMLSLFGCGIFDYYQGRSADSNLIFVSYPAIIIVAVFSERLFLIKVRTAKLWGSFCLALMVVLCFSVFPALPFAVASVKSRIPSVFSKETSPFVSRVAFINRYVKEGETVLILSYNSAAYHLYTGTKNPLGISGLAELYLVRDVDAIADYIGSGKAEKIFLDKGAFFHHTDYCGKILKVLDSNYRVASLSDDGQMVLYSRLKTKSFGN